MSDTSGLEQERDRLLAERRRLAAALGGEDPAEPDVGDRGDQAQRLEGDADLGRLDARIRELERLIADPPAAGPGEPAPGTVVTLRFPGGDEASFRVVTVAGEAGEGGAEEVVTVDSPLGRALAGHRAGDTLTYAGPDGELRAQLIALRPPDPAG